MKHGVALTRRNTTGPPCSVGRLTVHEPGGRPARRLAALQTTTYIRPTDASEQNNTGPLDRPVITIIYNRESKVETGGLSTLSDIAPLTDGHFGPFR